MKRVKEEEEEDKEEELRRCQSNQVAGKRVTLVAAGCCWLPLVAAGYRRLPLVATAA